MPAPSTMPERLARLGRRAGRGVLDLLYPPRCLSCRARLPSGAPLCASCVAGLERADPEAVRERLRALPEMGPALPFASAFALWRFDPDGALRALQHALKYQSRPRYGHEAGRWMAGALRGTLAPPPEAVVPVPLHRTRRLERGYNQSAQLGRGVADGLGIAFRPELLRRPRPTRSQTALTRRARWQNVAGAFATAPEPMDERALLLIDDVLTTGATMAAAARTLRRAGAAHTHLATLALAE